MAQYLYKCDVCGLEHDVNHSMKETPEIICPHCGHAAPPMRRMIAGAPAVSFKGVGWFHSGGYHTTEQGDKARADKVERERAKAIKSGKVKPIIKPGHR